MRRSFRSRVETEATDREKRSGESQATMRPLYSRCARVLVFTVYGMKRSLFGFVPVIVVLVAACSSNDSPSPSSSPDAVQPAGAATTGDAGGSTKDVECTHPGAGRKLENGRCACTTARKIAGDWSTVRTCREGDSCPTRDKGDNVVITQDGMNVRIDRGGTYSISGTLCGDYLLWSGGPKDGLNPECGQMRFTDDTHYTIDSCYVEAGECSRTHASGCPSLKGQCTGTGARAPETAAQISKVICL